MSLSRFRCTASTRQEDVFACGLRLVARRAHSRAEVERKLLARGFEPAQVRVVLDRLQEQRAIEDDEALAFRWAERLMEEGRSTPEKVKVKLWSRGLSGDVVDRAVAKAFQDWDARAAALRFVAQETDVPRLVRRLKRLGFDAETIAWAVGRLAADATCS